MSCDDITEYGDADKKTVNGEKQMKILVISDVHGTDYWKTCIDEVDEYDHIVQMKYKDKVHIIIHQNGLDLVVVDDEKHKCQYEMII